MSPNNNNRLSWEARAPLIALLGAVSGGVLFAFVDNPFTALFNGSLFLMALGTGLAIFLLVRVLIRSANRFKRWVGYAAISVCLLVSVGSLVSYLRLRPYLHHSVSTQQWQADLQFLGKITGNLDPSPLADGSFAGSTAKLIKELPDLSEEQIYSKLAELMASLHDGHSQLFPLQPATGFRMLPLQLYTFSDGTYVTAAAPEYDRLIGLRLTKIGNTPIENAFEIMKPLVSADNAWGVKGEISPYLLCPELLHSNGIVENEEALPFSFVADDGTSITANLRPVSMYRYLYWYLRPLAEWKYHRALDVSGPIYLRRPWDNYWFTYDPLTGNLIFEFRQIRDKRDEGFLQFGKRLIAFATSHAVRRIVIDIRENGGGDNTLVRDFVNELSDSAELNKRGTLFALIGRHTFSAAVNFATLLENQTETIFVGEPTAAGPNHFGDPKEIILPNSKLMVRVSSIRHDFGDPYDSRTTLLPDVPVEMSHRDHFSHLDPALSAALMYGNAQISEISVSPSVTRRYVGRYLYDSDRILQISDDGGRLSLVIGGFRKAFLYPTADNRFRTARGGLELAFLVDHDSVHDQIEWSVAGRSRRLSRVPPTFKTPHELLEGGNLSDGAAAYRIIKRDNPADTAVSERSLNSQGYKFLEARKYEQATLVLKLNVEFYPKSANAYDSLAEAYMKSGKTQDAIENYRKSLELDPHNDNARNMLKQLGVSH